MPGGRFRRTERNWNAVSDAVAVMNAFRDRGVRYPKEITDKHYPGYGPFCQLLTSNNNGRFYGQPWDATATTPFQL